MRRWIIERLGGYPDTDAAIAAIRILPLEEKNKVLTMAVKKLFNTVGPDDILKIIGRNWLFEGRPLRDAEVVMLKAEANQFQQSFLWKILQKELRYVANKKMYVDSKEIIDMVAGKLLVYYVDIIATRLKRMLE